MSTHPINLIVRFVLELTAFFALGAWGKESFAQPWNYLIMIGAPALSEGRFNFEASGGGDPSRRAGGGLHFLSS